MYGNTTSSHGRVLLWTNHKSIHLISAYWKLAFGNVWSLSVCYTQSCVWTTVQLHQNTNFWEASFIKNPKIFYNLHVFNMKQEFECVNEFKTTVQTIRHKTNSNLRTQPGWRDTRVLSKSAKVSRMSRDKANRTGLRFFPPWERGDRTHARRHTTAIKP